MTLLEEGGHVFLITGGKRQVDAVLRVVAQRRHEIVVAILAVADTVGRVIVQRDGDVAALHFLQQRIGIGDQVGAPAVARPVQVAATPAVAGFGLVRIVRLVHEAPLAPVPVHVHDQNIQRKIVPVVFLHDVDEILGGVGVPARIPRAERDATRHRHFTGNQRQLTQCQRIILTVGEQIPVGDVLLTAVGDPLILENGSAGIVQQVPSGAGHDAVLDGGGAGNAVQRR